MKLFMAFNVEGPTDSRFLTIISERIIEGYFLEKGITTEFSWTHIPKTGSSHENILNACKESINHNCVFIHRDADNNSWQKAYENHFKSAMERIESDQDHKYNPKVVPIIPVKETEAWMLVNKDVLRQSIDTSLNKSKLLLDYRIKNIEKIGNPREKIENAIHINRESLPRKQRRYAVNIGDLYDLIATKLPLNDLEKLDSFIKFKSRLIGILDSLTQH